MKITAEWVTNYHDGPTEFIGRVPGDVEVGDTVLDETVIGFVHKEYLPDEEGYRSYNVWTTFYNEETDERQMKHLGIFTYDEIDFENAEW